MDPGEEVFMVKQGWWVGYVGSQVGRNWGRVGGGGIRGYKVSSLNPLGNSCRAEIPVWIIPVRGVCFVM